jgi:hypothetical protein
MYLTSECKDGFELEEKQGSLMHSSETNEGIRAGVHGYDRRKRFSFSLGQYTTAFQVEVRALKACAVENTDRGHKNRNICILIVKLQLIPLRINRSTQNWSQTAISPL